MEQNQSTFGFCIQEIEGITDLFKIFDFVS